MGLCGSCGVVLGCVKMGELGARRRRFLPLLRILGGARNAGNRITWNSRDLLGKFRLDGKRVPLPAGSDPKSSRGGSFSCFFWQFFDRLKLFGMPAKHQPDFIYLRHVPLRKVHLFTLIQLLCLVLLWVIKVSRAAIVFPTMVRAQISAPRRHAALPAASPRLAPVPAGSGARVRAQDDGCVLLQAGAQLSGRPGAGEQEEEVGRCREGSQRGGGNAAARLALLPQLAFGPGGRSSAEIVPSSLDPTS